MGETGSNSNALIEALDRIARARFVEGPVQYIIRTQLLKCIRQRYKSYNGLWPIVRALVVVILKEKKTRKLKKKKTN